MITWLAVSYVALNGAQNPQVVAALEQKLATAWALRNPWPVVRGMVVVELYTDVDHQNLRAWLKTVVEAYRGNGLLLHLMAIRTESKPVHSIFPDPDSVRRGEAMVEVMAEIPDDALIPPPPTPEKP